MIRRTFLPTILLCLFMFIASSAIAEINEKLVDDLNQALAWELMTKMQCEYHSEKFDLAIPYYDIIIDKEDTITLITDLILNLNGDLASDYLDIVKGHTLSRAVISDANNQIQLVKIYDELAYNYGYQEVRRIIMLMRKRALQHYMLLTNTAQKLISESKQ